MARVTVEDCLKHVDNRFDLILIAAKRAHQLSRLTHRSVLEVGRDKPSVIALREISEGLIDKSILNEEESSLTMSGGDDGQISITEVEKELTRDILEDKSHMDVVGMTSSDNTEDKR